MMQAKSLDQERSLRLLRARRALGAVHKRSMNYLADGMDLEARKRHEATAGRCEVLIGEADALLRTSWVRGDPAAVDALLRRIAEEDLI